MLRKAIEIVMKLLESKNAGKINHVNVTYVLGQCGEIVAGREVVVKLNMHSSAVLISTFWTGHLQRMPHSHLGQKKGQE